MNGELISTTSQNYMYKSYIETILNNSHSTKEYQLKLSGYFGDDGDKDEDYVMNWNKGMEQRHLHFCYGQKVEMIGFIFSLVVWSSMTYICMYARDNSPIRL